MKQAISIKSMALRDVRAEGSRLEDQEPELKTQQTSLTHSINRLRGDLKSLMPKLEEMKMDIPDPDFPLSELRTTPNQTLRLRLRAKPACPDRIQQFSYCPSHCFQLFRH